MVGHLLTEFPEFGVANSCTENPQATAKSQTPPNSPQTADSPEVHLPDTIELTPMTRSPAGQTTHEPHEDTAASGPDILLLRADTEQRLGDDQTPVEQSNPLLAPHSPRGDHSTPEVSPTWRGHYQDFYVSKWFRSMPIFIIVSVILVALLLYIFASPLFDTDLFSSYEYLISVPTFLGPVFFFFCLVVGGVFGSKVFR